MQKCRPASYARVAGSRDTDSSPAATFSIAVGCFPAAHSRTALPCAAGTCDPAPGGGRVFAVLLLMPKTNNNGHKNQIENINKPSHYEAGGGGAGRRAGPHCPHSSSGAVASLGSQEPFVIRQVSTKTATWRRGAEGATAQQALASSHAGVPAATRPSGVPQGCPLWGTPPPRPIPRVPILEGRRWQRAPPYSALPAALSSCFPPFASL